MEAPHRAVQLLYAQKAPRQVLLRIEDTIGSDRPTGIAAILDGLKWLGLDWGRRGIYQFSRARATARWPNSACQRQGLLLITRPPRN